MPLLLTDADLAAMRAAQQSGMPDSWALAHLTTVEDALGSTTTWTVTASGTGAAGTGARLMPAGYMASEAILAGRPSGSTAWIITLPYGTTVANADRIIIGTALTVGAVVTSFEAYRDYEVTGVSSPHSLETAVRVAAAFVL